MKTIDVTSYKLGNLCLKAAEQLRTEGKTEEAAEAQIIGEDLKKNGINVIEDTVSRRCIGMQVRVP